MHDAVSGARVFAERNGIGEDITARLAIVVEELVTNLYEHGGPSDGPFEIELSASSGEIFLVVVDDGRPFDPALASVPRTIPDRGGGAGLALVRAWASRTDYRTIGGRNRLEITLPLRWSGS